MRILWFIADLGGCMRYRIEQPMAALAKHNVVWTALPELPNNPWGSDLDALSTLMQQYDVIGVQRCYKYEIVHRIKNLCELLGKPLVYETDDDYLNLPPTNPCYPELASPQTKEEYKALLALADMITVSTDQLKTALYPYNKNIVVLRNNVEQVYCGEVGDPVRGYLKEQVVDGRVEIPNVHGLVSIPSYWDENVPERRGYLRHRVVRIGYACTPSHREDFKTIAFTLEKIMEKYDGKIWLVFIGDRWFFDKMSKGRGRIIHIPVSQYNLYMYHLRNLDIGLAPLLPDIFNMSKSPIKAIEYGSWGIPAVLPNYVTYNSEFTHGKNCLMYYNSRDFQESLEELINNHELRLSLGKAARDYVAQNRLERQHTQERYDAYLSVLGNSTPLVRFQPKGRTAKAPDLVPQEALADAS